MKRMPQARPDELRSPLAGRVGVLAVLVSLLLVISGCGDKKDKAATQVAAKVNKEEISVHQVNFVLQRQQGVAPDQADAAGQQILERLIDQELAVQKADELKVSRDPNVVMAIEAARREIVARAYAEKVAQGAAKPTAEEIKAYYDANPALFKERRIYQLREILAEMKPEQLKELTEKLNAFKSPNDIVDYLKAGNIRFADNTVVRPAEQIPLAELGGIAAMKDGQASVAQGSSGARILVLLASRSEPVDEAKAQPAIEQFLLNDRRRQLVESDRKALRSAAKIEYMGKFEKSDKPTPESGTSPASGAASSAEHAASGLDADAINKGLKGLK